MPGNTVAPSNAVDNCIIKASYLAPLADSIHLLLRLLRDSGSPQKVMAVGGQYQQTLPQGRTFQLLRLALQDDLHLIPEISGNRLMVSIRLMRHERDDRLHAIGQDESFELTLCARRMQTMA